MTDDATLLRDYSENHAQEAFAELVRRRLNLVYSVALRQVGGDTHLAQDVVQKVFADLARKAAVLSERAVLTGWLYRSAQFAASDVVRSERRRRAREQESYATETLASLDSPADWDRLRPLLDEAMGELDEADRDAVAMRFFEERPFAEIGGALDLTDDAARKRVDRALDKLRAALGRKGVTSTGAALGLALAGQAATAAPAGLAAAVTMSSLAAGAAVASTASMGGAAIITLMSTSKITVGVVTAIAAVAVGVAIYEADAVTKARAEIATVKAEQDGLLAKLRNAEGRLQAQARRTQAVEDDNGNLLKVIEGMKAEAAKLRTAAVAAPAPSAPITHDMVESRYRRGQELARQGDAAGALTELLWCFDEGMIRVSSYTGVRSSFLLGEIKRLAVNYPAAADALRERRDAAEKRMLASATDREAASDFAVLNSALGEDNRNVAMYDQLPPDDARRQALLLRVYDQLLTAQRYADAATARTYAQMTSQFELNTRERPISPNIDPERIREANRRVAVTNAVKNIEVLAGSGNLDDARALAQKLMAFDGSDETRNLLQRHLARAGQPQLLAGAARN